MIKPKVGVYFFSRKGRCFGIYQYDKVTETTASSVFVKNAETYEEAVKEVYRLNGWKKKM